MAEQFIAEYTVTIGDINYGGHLGNDKALVIFQDARIQLLSSLGFSEKEIGESRGIIMVESGVRYLKEVFLHQLLQVEISVSDLQPKKFTLEYRVFRLPEREQVLSGFSSFLAFDYNDRRVTRLPQAFSDALLRFVA